MTPLAPVITASGLAALFAANSQGLEAQISHIALGDGGTNAGVGYTPNTSMDGLVRERVRVPVGGGERVTPTEIEVQALVDSGPSFWVREVGFVLATGVFLAIWSDPTIPLAYKSEGVDLALAYYLALEAVPANSVNVVVTGPSVNLTMGEPFVTLTTSLIRTQTHIMTADVERLSAVIANTWR